MRRCTKGKQVSERKFGGWGSRKSGGDVPVASSCHLVVSFPRRFDVADVQTHHEVSVQLTLVLLPYP